MKARKTFPNGETLHWKTFLDVLNYGDNLAYILPPQARKEEFMSAYEATGEEYEECLKEWRGY